MDESEDLGIGDEMQGYVADILMALSETASGDYAARIETDLSEDHPAGALARAVNEMISTLGRAEERGAQYRAELEEKIDTIAAQRNAISELSTPIMQVWDGVLCLPVVGVMDTQRSADTTESLLRTVADQQARHVIIDITGIEVMDTRTADHFIRMTKAVRLLGADCVISGINPNIAQTIVHMGVELDTVVTHASLREALQQFVGTGDGKGRIP